MICLTKPEHPFSCGLLLSLGVFKFKKYLKLDLTKY